LDLEKNKGNRKKSFNEINTNKKASLTRAIFSIFLKIASKSVLLNFGIFPAFSRKGSTNFYQNK